MKLFLRIYCLFVLLLGCGSPDSDNDRSLSAAGSSPRADMAGLTFNQDQDIIMDMDMMIRALDAQPPIVDAADSAASAAMVDADDVGCTADRDCDDSIFCNGRERCSGGRCFASPISPCTDGIGCTDDICDEENTRCENPLNDEACPDQHICDRKLGCLPIVPCLEDSECDDGSACNGQEVCRDNRCLRGEPVVCNDDIECTADVCVDRPDEDTRCEYLPIHGRCVGRELCSTETGCGERPPCERDDDCDDGSYCNGTETCDVDRAVCVPGVGPEVDDEIPCTIDVCSDELAMVLHRPALARCTDGQFCNGAEICDPSNGCMPGTPPNLSDGVGCTIDECDEDTDLIRHRPDDSVCNDQLFCNGEEVCDAIQDCQPGEPPQVNDGLDCTIDTCNEIDDRIEHRPTNAVCDDDLFCNGQETCDPTNGCQVGQPPSVDDGQSCTEDICDEASDRIEHRPIDERCNDGLFCNGSERCDVNAGCQAGTPPILDDGVACTADTCDESTDTILHNPDNTRCNDGLFCNGAETCNQQLGCQSNQPPVIDDGVDCTEDFCDEVNDRVINRPNDTRCDNALFCDGAEICDAISGCIQGPPPTLSDDIACTVDRCNEDTDEITHAPDNARCADAEFCNGIEICDIERGCLAGQAPPDGTICQPNPREICLNNKCVDSQCGDGFVDVEMGEECEDGNTDDGDGCSSICQNEGDANGEDETNYTGCYALNAPIDYRCTDVLFGREVVTLRADRLDFSRLVNELLVRRGLPIPGPIPQPSDMTQRPAPDDGRFNVRGVIPEIAKKPTASSDNLPMRSVTVGRVCSRFNFRDLRAHLPTA